MVLLVQTPRGTIAIPPQGFFQQQPSPFENSIGLLTSQPPRQFEPRLPAPVDLDSASAVQPSSPTPPRNVIPQSSDFDLARRLPDDPEPLPPTSFDIAVDRDNANPFAAPIDPANVFGTIGTIAGPPGFGALGRGFGNLAAFANEPPAIQNEINPFSAFINSITPFGLFGRSVENQARDIARDFERTVIEDALSFTDFTNPAFEPFFDEPVARPDEDDGPGPGPGPGPGSATDNAANQGLEDEAEDEGPGVEGDGSEGDPSFICTAAWNTGISAPATWSSDKRMLAWIIRNDPDAYAGYKKVGPWIAKRVHRGKLLWMARLFPRSWAYEIDQRQGKDTSKYPLFIKIENRLQRAFVRPLFRLWGRR